MARPEQKGCSYFPLNCNFSDDRKLKLLRGEFGGQAEAVIIRLWCAIYADEGYYVRFDEDDVALLAEDLGRGFTIGYIREVLQGSCKRGLFDETVFAQFQILTSKGVQRRYLEIKKKKRTISVIKDFWLLEPSDFKEEDKELLLKLRFFEVSGEQTAVFAEETTVNAEKIPQRKENKRKAKQSKAAAPKGAGRARSILLDWAGGWYRLRKAVDDFAEFRAGGKHPLTDRAAELACKRLETLADEAGVQNRAEYQVAVLEQSVERGWEGLFKVDGYVERPAIYNTPGGADKPRAIAADADAADLF